MVRLQQLQSPTSLQMIVFLLGKSHRPMMLLWTRQILYQLQHPIPLAHQAGLSHEAPLPLVVLDSAWPSK